MSYKDRDPRSRWRKDYHIAPRLYGRWIASWPEELTASVGQHSVDNAHDGHLKRFEILTLFAAQEPKSNEFVDVRYV